MVTSTTVEKYENGIVTKTVQISDDFAISCHIYGLTYFNYLQNRTGGLSYKKLN